MTWPYVSSLIIFHSIYLKKNFNQSPFPTGQVGVGEISGLCVGGPKLGLALDKRASGQLQNGGCSAWELGARVLDLP